MCTVWNPLKNENQNKTKQRKMKCLACHLSPPSSRIPTTMFILCSLSYVHFNSTSSRRLSFLSESWNCLEKHLRILTGRAFQQKTGDPSWKASSAQSPSPASIHRVSHQLVSGLVLKYNEWPRLPDVCERL